MSTWLARVALALGIAWGGSLLLLIAWVLLAWWFQRPGAYQRRLEKLRVEHYQRMDSFSWPPPGSPRVRLSVERQASRGNGL